MTLTILSLEDEADVRDALERDLEQFWDKIRLEVAEDVDDAWAVIDEIVEDGDELALVLSDHRLPGKSGVGGGILAIAPGRASVATWSPGLNARGNSALGTLAMEHLVRETGWSVFG